MGPDLGEGRGAKVRTRREGAAPGPQAGLRPGPEGAPGPFLDRGHRAGEGGQGPLWGTGTRKATGATRDWGRGVQARPGAARSAPRSGFPGGVASGGAGSPRHSWKAEPSSATREASTRHLVRDTSPQGSSSLAAGGGGGGAGGAACAFFRAGLRGTAGAQLRVGAGTSRPFCALNSSLPCLAARPQAWELSSTCLAASPGEYSRRYLAEAQ